MWLFILGLVLGGAVSWAIAHGYYVKSGADQRAELAKLKSELKPENTLRRFERLLEDAPWERIQVDSKDVWVCADDNTLQIHIGERSSRFSERWTTVFPDRSASMCPVYLKIGDVTIKELVFVTMDGGRIFVPLTECRLLENKEAEYFWNLDSIQAKVASAIGEFYIYENLEGVAQHSGVRLVK